MTAPILIGAVGGSGTRVVTRILARAGFFIGADRNQAEDSEPVMGFFNTWLRPYLAAGGVLSGADARAAAVHFEKALSEHRRGIESREQPWVVKVPRSLLLVPYWLAAFPELRFVHVIRNGLDMAYSSDHNQLNMIGDLMLPEDERVLNRPLRAMAYWRTANLQAAAFATSSLGARYHRLRFEDLCRIPESEIGRLAAFADAPVDTQAAAAEVSPPASLDRWRGHPAHELVAMLQLGRPALERFGYWNPRLLEELGAASAGSGG